jgi:hypothetical protein
VRLPSPLTGEPDAASALLEKFTWGHSFIEINQCVNPQTKDSFDPWLLLDGNNSNRSLVFYTGKDRRSFFMIAIFIMPLFFYRRELLDKYAACKDSNDVIAAQNDWLEMLHKEAFDKERRKERAMDSLYRSSSSSGSGSEAEGVSGEESGDERVCDACGDVEAMMT